MMKKHFFTSLFTLFYLGTFSAQTDEETSESQDATNKNAKTYTLADIQVKGALEFSKNQILDLTHLNIGDEISIPGNKINHAVKKLWNTHLFNDVAIHILKIQDRQLYLQVYLEGLPELYEIEFKGIKKSQFEELFKDNPIKQGVRISQDLLKSIQNALVKYYQNKGYPEAQIYFKTYKNDQNKVHLVVQAEKGNRVRVSRIIFEGNKQVPASSLLKAMKNTKKKNFLTNLFSASKYVRAPFEEDLKSIVTKYQSLGFRDAAVVSDAIWKIDEKNYGIKIKLNEGERYYLGNVSFIGNSVFDNNELKEILTYKKGDPYDFIGIKKKTSDSQDDSSISSIYLDKGYLFSRVTPIETNINERTVDVEIRIEENKAAVFNKVTFSGNTITKDHVIARELLTRPGDLFSKINIKRTLFGLAQLGFFEPEKIVPELKPDPATNSVNLNWKLTEKSSSQVQLQGGYGGGRFIGTLSLNFGNFSLGNLFKGKEWNPIPQGDGQQLSLSAQAGHLFQSYGISFTEPWISGRTPASLGFSLNYSRQKLSSSEVSDPQSGNLSDLSMEKNTDSKQNSVGGLSTFGASLGFTKRLNWPDDYFSLSLSLNYDRYVRHNTDMGIKELPKQGVSNDLNYSISLRRFSAGPDQVFPTSGSDLDLSGMFTFPYSLFNKKNTNAQNNYKWLEYYKLKIRSYWYKEILGKLVGKIGGEFGFLGNYSREQGISPFQRFFIGGTGLLGFRLGGRDYIPLRGYPDAEQKDAISPTGGGVVYNRFLFELRYPLLMNSIAKIWALGFAEAGNSANEYKKYKPFELKKAAGVGLRTFMPAFGFLGLDLGYGFDSIVPSKWQTHFIIGRDL